MEQHTASKPKHLTRTILQSIGLLLAILFLTNACSTDEASAADVAIVDESEGTVEWREANSDSWTELSSEQELASGRALRTSAGSHAWISFPDGSKVLLGPKSELAIVELSVDDEQKQRVIRLDQPRGESRHVVVDQEAGDTVYEVSTPSGTSSTDQGVFAVSANGDTETRVAVSRGLVRCDTGTDSYPVTAGKMVSLRRNETPQTAAFVLYGEGQVSEMGDRWVIGDRTFIVDAATVVRDEVSVGDMVYVEGHVQPDGTLVADLISLDQSGPAPIAAGADTSDPVFMSKLGQEPDTACTSVTGTVTRLEDDVAILHDGTIVNLAEAAEIEREVALYSVLLVTTCWDEDGTETVQTVHVTVLEAPEDDGPDGDEEDDADGNQTTICHIPPGNPANAHTITVGEPAVSAHLAHGDFVDACGEEWERENDVDQDLEDGYDGDEASMNQATICHRPPGNPDNAKTITVGEPAVDAHLGHGDSMGAC